MGGNMMASINMTKEAVSKKCRNVGGETLMVICCMLFLFEAGYLQNQMPAGILNRLFFIFPLYLGYVAYVGWGLFQMAKVIQYGEGTNNDTPPPVPSLFKGSRDQVMWRLQCNGLILFMICAVLFLSLSLGYFGNIISYIMRNDLLIPFAVVFFFGYHGYLGVVLLQLSKMVKADASLFHITGTTHSSGEGYATASKTSMVQSDRLSQCVEHEGANKEEEGNR